MNTVFLCTDFFMAGAFTVIAVDEWSKDNTRGAGKCAALAIGLVAFGITRAV